MSTVTDILMAGAADFTSLVLILSALVDLSERRTTNGLFSGCSLIIEIQNDMCHIIRMCFYLTHTKHKNHVINYKNNTCYT